MTKLTYHNAGRTYHNKHQLCESIGWDNLNWNNLCNSEIRVADNFKGYQFKRQRNMDLQSHAVKRLQMLREKYDYIRLWYSGGKDSHCILEWAKQAGIVFDEIAVLEHDEHVLFCNEEIKSLKISKDLYHKLTWINVNEQILDYVYKNKEWWQHSTVFSILAVMELDVFNRYVTPSLKELDIPNNLCDITGGITPTIFYKDGWKFFLNEYSCSNMNYSHCENFLVNDSYPEIYEAYINNICDTFEEKQIMLDKEDMLKLLTTKPDPSRFIRDQIPWFKNLGTAFQWRKTSNSRQIKEFEHEPWGRFVWTNKYHKATKNAYGTNSEYWINYCNSDWNKINRMYDFGTIITKDFELLEKTNY